MIEKLSIFLLGYNIEDLYENASKAERDKLIPIVDNTIDLIIFCAITIKLDEDDCSNLNHYHGASNDNLSNYVFIKKREDLFNNSVTNTDISLISRNVSEKRGNHFMKSLNKFTSFGSEALTVNTHRNSETMDKDYFLFTMYKSLSKYFEKYPVQNLTSKELSIIEDNSSFSPSNILNNRKSKNLISNNINNNNNKITMLSTNSKAGSVININNLSQNIGNQNDEHLNDFYESLYKLLANTGSMPSVGTNSYKPRSMSETLNGNNISMGVSITNITNTKSLDNKFIEKSNKEKNTKKEEKNNNYFNEHIEQKRNNTGQFENVITVNNINNMVINNTNNINENYLYQVKINDEDLDLKPEISFNPTDGTLTKLKKDLINGQIRRRRRRERRFKNK